MDDEGVVIAKLIDYESEEESEEEDVGMTIEESEEMEELRIRRLEEDDSDDLNVMSLSKSCSDKAYGNRLLPPTRAWFRTGLPISLRLHCCHFLLPKGTLLDFFILEGSIFYFACVECCARVTMEQDPENLQHYTVKSGATIELGNVEDEQGQLNEQPTLLSWGRRQTFPHPRR